LLPAPGTRSNFKIRANELLESQNALPAQTFGSALFPVISAARIFQNSLKRTIENEKIPL